MRNPRLVVAGLVIGSGLSLAAPMAAFADGPTQLCGDVACVPPVLPSQPQNGPAPYDPGATAQTTSSTSSGLAFTGADIAGLTIFAFGAVAAGAALRAGSRRSARRSTAAS